MANTLANEAHQRSLKDFLTLYNTITEYCFGKCVSNFNERRASEKETLCVDTCTNNYVQYNQRFMFHFVDHQERRKRDLESAAREAEQKAAADAIAAAATAAAAENVTTDTPTPTTTSAAVTTGAQELELQQLTESHNAKLQQASQLLENLGTGPTTQSSSGSSVDVENKSGAQPLSEIFSGVNADQLKANPGLLNSQTVSDQNVAATQQKG